MTTNITPEEHSNIVGGSTAARLLNCPRSYALTKLVPDVETDSPYAREGTALHEMMAAILSNNSDPEGLLPFTYVRKDAEGNEEWSFTVDHELWRDVGQVALDQFDDFCDYIEDLAEDEIDMVIERRCALPGIEGAFGTSDVIWRCGRFSGVWDWKFGNGEVSAEENSQLLFYARAAMSDHPEFFGGEAGDSFGDLDPNRAIYLTICQPKRRPDTPDEWITTAAYAEQFRLDLVEAAEVALRDGVKAPCTRGPWCNFARCKVICPLHTNATMALAEKMDKIKSAGGLAKVEAETEPVEFKALLADLLELAEVAEDWSRSVFGYAHDFSETHGAPEGWQLQAKRSAGREYLVGEKTIINFARRHKIKMDEYLPRKLLTVAQLEKLLKAKDIPLPEKYAGAKPSSGTTLKRASDPSKAVEGRGQRLAALGDKLAAFRGE